MASGGRCVEALNQVRWRLSWRGGSVHAAEVLGVSRSHLISLNNGTMPMTERTASLILTMAREEELALADRVEAELHRQPKYPMT